jgi:hypothetical protein
MHIANETPRPSHGNLIVQIQDEDGNWCRLTPIAYTRTGRTRSMGLHRWEYNYGQAIRVAQSTINGWRNYRDWIDAKFRVVDEFTGEVVL